MEKNAKNVHQKLVLGSILKLVNTLKEPMNGKLLKENDQKPFKGFLLHLALLWTRL